MLIQTVDYELSRSTATEMDRKIDNVDVLILKELHDTIGERLGFLVLLLTLNFPVFPDYLATLL